MTRAAHLHFVTKRGSEIASVFEDLAKLRIAVFRDYPYLYEGSVAYEKEYLKIYSQSPKAFLFGVYDGDRMVGATTCIPLVDESSELQQPFQNQGYDLTRIFYFGESILLTEYRGAGLGHRFFDERENHVRSFESYELCCFCAVDRGDSHPAKPADYRPNDDFWLKRGYHRNTSLYAFMSWPDIGETASTSKKMIFWTKPTV